MIRFLCGLAAGAATTAIAHWQGVGSDVLTIGLGLLAAVLVWIRLADEFFWLVVSIIFFKA